MNLKQRIFLSTIRLWKKNILFFLFFFILTITFSVLIIFQHNLTGLENTLLRNLNPVVTLRRLSEEADRFSNEIISLITELDIVSDYNFTGTMSFISSNTSFYQPVDFFNSLEDSERDFLFLLPEFKIENQRRKVTGLINPFPIEYIFDFLSLREGRLLTQDEIENAHFVTVISQSYAQLNSLAVGDFINLSLEIPDEICMYTNTRLDELECVHLEGAIRFEKDIEFEIVGLLDVDIININDNFRYNAPHGFVVNTVEISNIVDLYNKIFVPFTTLEMISREILPYYLMYSKAFASFFNYDLEAAYFGAVPNNNYPTTFNEVIFVLDSPIYLRKFENIANYILPEGWEVRTTTPTFSHFFSAMDSIMHFINFITIFFLISILFVLYLVGLLFVKNKKYEIGIYLSLGYKRINILLHALGEYLLVYSMSFILALTSIVIIINPLVNYIFELEILNQLDMIKQSQQFQLYGLSFVDPTIDARNLFSTISHFGSNQLEVDEVLNLLNINFSITQFLKIISLNLTTIFISIFIPIIIIIYKKPLHLLSLKNI